MTPGTGILGGGISGLALAAHLEVPFEVLEAAPRLGGLCASVIESGFTFDAAGPHIMFSRNQAVLDHMVEVLGGNVHRRRRENKIWFKGCFVKYPFENGLSDLPKEDCFDCILGYLRNPWTKEPENLEEWSYATFGKGISEKYFLPYNRKIWSVEPSEITLEWVSRIPKPPLEDVLKSAVGIPTEGYLHQLHFHYPLHGGFESLLHAFRNRIQGGPVLMNHPVLGLRGGPGAWQVEGPDGTHHYQHLVSTLPIHELARIWEGFPRQGLEALGGLRYNRLINLLIGVSEDRGHPYTALYVPDPSILFHRLSFPANFSPHCVPPGHGAMMAELTCSAGDPRWEMDDEALLDRAIADLARMELLDPATVVYRKAVRFEYGYPIYDRDYFRNVSALRRAVEEAGVRLLGRFAQFDYINTDTCVERAMAMAQELNTGIRTQGPGPRWS